MTLLADLHDQRLDHQFGALDRDLVTAGEHVRALDLVDEAAGEVEEQQRKIQDIVEVDRIRVGDRQPWVISDFDTSFRNLLSNQPLMVRQKVVGTTDARFGRFSPVYGLGDWAPEVGGG
jgi:hypothetical protein